MWYLLACREWEEREIVAFCKEHLSKQVLRDAFVLTCDRMRRYEGRWHLERRLMFPACVFLESGEEEALSGELREYGLFREQGKGLLWISREAEEFLKRLCGREHHLGMSRGIIVKGETRVTEGPLKGMEKRICRIDRHKRLAQVETVEEWNHRYIMGESRMAVGNMAGNKEGFRYIPAGLEIMEKVV